MYQRKDGNKMFEKNKKTQGTRSSGVLGHKGGHESHVLQSKDSAKKNGRLDPKYNRKTSAKHTFPRGVTSTESSEGDGETSGDDDGEGAANASEDDDNEEEPEGLAPSVVSVRTSGFQAGRTLPRIISGPTATTKKRSWSTSSEEERQPLRPVKSPKSNKSKAKLAELSDDDDYNGVDLISDSDEEEPNLEKLEEKMIIDSEEENEEDPLSTVSPFHAQDTSSDDWQGIHFDDGLFTSDIPFFEDQIGRTDPHPSTAIPNSDDTTVPNRRSSSSTGRRVRFADDISGGFKETISTASSANDDIFPDLFLNQDSLDPQFRQLIENDNDDHRQELMDAGLAFWDAEEAEDFQLEKHSLDNGTSSEAGSSSGYETDLGETTDEEVLPPRTINCPQSVLRINSSTPTRGGPIPRPASTPIRKPATTPTPASRRHGPSMASWVVDPTKPIAVIDSTGKTMLIYPAPRSVKKSESAFISSLSSSATASPRTSMAALAKNFDGAFDDSENDRSDPSSQEQTTTMLGSAANLMMPGLLHGAPGMEHILGGSVLGPPEAFYPFKSIDANGMLLDDDDEDVDDDDDDPEDMLNIQDFIDFGDDSSDIDDQMLDDSDSTLLAKRLTDTPSKAPAMPAQRSSSIDLLQHFDKGVVASFRRNQTRHQSLLRRPSSPYGIKGGRHFAANTPISPSKRKASRSLSSTFSPFNGVTARRKVANRTHKRSRSAV
ncbi:hypothetical protein MMC30_008204 [Trapelia coarctata]|nr:hypothetical protein [Trapelia coarctata]